MKDSQQWSQPPFPEGLTPNQGIDITKKPTFWSSASAGQKLALLVGAVYVVSPADLIPGDLLTLVGLADDAGVIAALGVLARSIFKQRRHNLAQWQYWVDVRRNPNGFYR